MLSASEAKIKAQDSINYGADQELKILEERINEAILEKLKEPGCEITTGSKYNEGYCRIRLKTLEEQINESILEKIKRGRI